jgi:hypothetical protein
MASGRHVRALYRPRFSGVSNLPEAICSITGLITLVLPGCYTPRSLPEAIATLTGLSALSLQGSYALTNVPEAICAQTGLSVLKLGRCSALASLPKDRLTCQYNFYRTYNLLLKRIACDTGWSKSCCWCACGVFI